MWSVWESRSVIKNVKKLPKQVLERYEFWKNIVEVQGPDGLKYIKGFKDEALKGNWKGYRSSRLNIQYRVIYRIMYKELFVYVENIVSHDYWRK